ncbi:uncharacterized protein LOC114539448 [Dendronephthya gigantea]|uniref:uncharacterized protein LOC114539448 n=1 Tax=Dendronephthya gigantea TaxID=151771 RepID=UPI001068DEE4|nr:uncharacterized protein LOC114539448 [Dendronephthya gigantea]
MFFLGRIYTFQASSVLRVQCTSILLLRGARKRRESSPQNEGTEKYLREQFQVPKKSAKLLSQVCTVGDIEERVEYFKSIGLTQENIELVFRKFPRPIMTSDVSEMNKRVVFLSGYTTKFRDPNVLVTHLIPQYPPLLFHSVEAMEKRIQLLKTCNLNEEEIAKVLRYNPMTILTKLEDSFEDLVKYLKDSGLPDQTIHKFFTKQPRSITFRWEAIEKRVRFFMDELDYTRERIIEVFTNNPMVLTASVERMRERSNFIKDEMGLTNHSLHRSPLVLRYSLERLQWRYYYLCQIGYQFTDDTYLLNVLYVTDELFAKYVAKRPVNEILEFKDRFYENLNSISDNSDTVNTTIPC